MSAAATFNLADNEYIVPCLAAKCWSFIDANTTACVKSDRAVSTLSHVTLVSLLKRDSLRTKELPLFEAVKHWAEAKCEEKGLEPTGEAMREILGEAVNFIRLPTMSQQDFAKQVVPSGVLTDREALEIHQYFYRGVLSPNMRFPFECRAGIASNPFLHQCRIHECIRVNKINLYYMAFMQQNEELKFVMEPRNVHLKGVRLFTGKREYQSFSAVIRLLDENGDEVEAKEGTFEGKVMTRDQFGCDVIYGCDVMFEVPVLIWRSAKYTIEVYLKTLRGANVIQITTGLLAAVEEAGIYFFF